MSYLYVPGLARLVRASKSPLEIPSQPSVAWKGKSIAPKSWPRVWKKAISESVLSTAISHPSTAFHIVVSLTSFPAAYHANHTRLQAAKKVTPMSEPSGPALLGWRPNANQPSSSSKMSLPFETTSNPSGPDFKSWVSSGLRHCFKPPQNPVRRISENDSLPLLPTPSASTYGSNRGGAMGRVGADRPSLDTMVSRIPTPLSRDHKDGCAADYNVPTNGILGRWVTRIPTPTATDAKGSGDTGSTASGRHSGTTLTDAVVGPARAGRIGRLNPRFSEWLQGLPIGWTSLEPLATSAARLFLTQERTSFSRMLSTDPIFKTNNSGSAAAKGNDE